MASRCQPGTSLPPGTHVIRYVARAVTTGEFRAMPAVAAPLYDPAVSGHGASAAMAIEATPCAEETVEISWSPVDARGSLGLYVLLDPGDEIEETDEGVELRDDGQVVLFYQRATRSLAATEQDAHRQAGSLPQQIPACQVER